MDSSQIFFSDRINKIARIKFTFGGTENCSITNIPSFRDTIVFKLCFNLWTCEPWTLNLFPVYIPKHPLYSTTESISLLKLLKEDGHGLYGIMPRTHFEMWGFLFSDFNIFPDIMSVNVVIFA